MKLAAILTRDIGQQYYLIDGVDCYIVEETDSRIWPNDWLSADIVVNGATSHCHVCKFGTLADGVVTTDKPHETTEPSGNLFDVVKIGASSTLWHNHAVILASVLRGECGVVVDCDAEIERVSERQHWVNEFLRPFRTSFTQNMIDLDTNELIYRVAEVDYDNDEMLVSYHNYHTNRQVFPERVAIVDPAELPDRYIEEIQQQWVISSEDVVTISNSSGSVWQSSNGGLVWHEIPQPEMQDCDDYLADAGLDIVCVQDCDMPASEPPPPPRRRSSRPSHMPPWGTGNHNRNHRRQYRRRRR